MSLLTLDHRPARFADMAGQESARLILQALVSSGDVPPALLFSGHSGTGKTSAARILAAALNCLESKEGDACGACVSCLAVQSSTSLAVHEVDAATSGGVDEVRALKDLASYAVSGATWRVILLDEAHTMSRQAFNALLKVLEEPPSRTVFVLLTTAPEKILATVRSRSMPVSFYPLPVEVIKKRLVDICVSEQIEMPVQVVTEIAASANGGMRDAIMLLDQSRRVGVRSLESLRSLTGHSDIPARLVTALVSQDHGLAMSLVEEFYVVSADTSDLVTGMLNDLLARFAEHSIAPSRMIAATKLLWDGRSSASSSVRSAKTQTEALVTLLYAVFRDPERDALVKPILRSEESPKSANGSRRVTAEELAQIDF
jgi:DNA polymerase-3 subunit gamma/tau